MPARNAYHFRTDWTFKAPLERVWPVIVDIEKWPRWWTDFRKVRIRAGDGRSIGSIFDCETRSTLPYTLKYSLELIKAQELKNIELRATGDLVGTGRWEFSAPRPGQSLATYYWDVATTKSILNLLAPLARGLFAKAHEQIMERGYRALRPYVEKAAT